MSWCDHLISPLHLCKPLARTLLKQWFMLCQSNLYDLCNDGVTSSYSSSMECNIKSYFAVWIYQEQMFQQVHANSCKTISGSHIMMIYVLGPVVLTCEPKGTIWGRVATWKRMWPGAALTFGTVLCVHKAGWNTWCPRHPKTVDLFHVILVPEKLQGGEDFNQDDILKMIFWVYWVIDMLWFWTRVRT